MQTFHVSQVMKYRKGASEIRFAENSWAENDEKHRSANGCAYIAFRKCFGPHLEAYEKLTPKEGSEISLKRRASRTEAVFPLLGRV